MTCSAAFALLPDAAMIVPSDLLGPLTVEPEELVEFHEGLLGFSECRRFVLLATEREGLYWLQSADHSALVFLLADPFLFFPGYAVDVGEVELARLEAAAPGDVAVLAIVTLPAEPGASATANLQGPLALNLAVRRGKQLTLDDTEFGLRAPLDLLPRADG